uniref:RRM domain-containing protein n=1 Tax=Globodera pallida TaxID=36090 RepID=A0A183BM92_GLOPA
MADKAVNSNERTGDQQREKNGGNGRRRRRPLTNGVRTELRALIENAVLDSRSALLSTVFLPSPSEDDDGTLGKGSNFLSFKSQFSVAPLSAVLSHLQQIGHNVARFAALSHFALKSIANRTRVFAIEEDRQQQHLFVRVSPQILLRNDEKTVFVDNLPPLCTAERLRKRATFFGRVVGVHMPQIGRIQRRVAQMIGGVWPAHSGFAFVQLASKTAAQRFCKRYSTNSRLKRLHHHHHGHKHGRKKTTTTATKTGQETSGNQIVVNSNENSKGQNVVSGHESKVEKGGHESEEDGVVEETREQRLFPPPLADESGIVEMPHLPPLHPSSLTLVSNLNTSTCSMWSGGSAEGRFRCNSIAEESAMSESGNETDTQMGKRRDDEKASKSLRGGETAVGALSDRKRRRRRLMHRQTITHHQSLNALFRHIQVFPLKQYRELRTDYLRIKKTRMETLKKQLMGTARKAGEEHSAKLEDENEKRRTNKEENGEEEGLNRRKGRRRKGKRRGIRKLLGRAERAKTAEYEKNKAEVC